MCWRVHGEIAGSSQSPLYCNLFPSGMVNKTRKVSVKRRPWMETSARLLKLHVIHSTVFMLLNMNSTNGISHFHSYIALCERGTPVGCYIATSKLST